MARRDRQANLLRANSGLRANERRAYCVRWGVPPTSHRRIWIRRFGLFPLRASQARPIICASACRATSAQALEIVLRVFCAIFTPRPNRGRGAPPKSARGPRVCIRVRVQLSKKMPGLGVVGGLEWAATGRCWAATREFWRGRVRMAGMCHVEQSGGCFVTHR